MRKLPFAFWVSAGLAMTFLISFQSCTKTSENKTLSLFNGVDLSGWHADIPRNDSIQRSFIVRDSMLVSLGKPEGHLITDSVFENYRLEVQYRFASVPGNCGILVHVSKPRALYEMFPQSIEVQLMHENAGDFWCIVEDITVLDMEKRRGPKAEWGITEGKQRRIMNLADSVENKAGEWNTMILECKEAEIRVWVNGMEVNHGFDCTARRGQIALQAEGAEVEFRKLLLTPLTLK